jgi:hypothetical protein
MKQVLGGIRSGAMAVVLATGAAAQGAPAIDLAEAREVLAAAVALDRPDLSSLWGRPIACPLLLADPRTRQAVASHGDSGGILRPVQGAFAGTLPEAVGIANYGLASQSRRVLNIVRGNRTLLAPVWS